MILRRILLLIFSVFFAFAIAQNGEVNVYSARHYDSDIALFKDFSERTGIKVNLLEGKSDALIERMISEGKNSPADILISADAGRLWRAEQAGLFATLDSEILTTRIATQFRHPENKWFGLSRRIRIIVYNPNEIAVGEINNYEDLADPKWHGQICVRSSSNIYNQSLLASMIAADGTVRAEEWAKGLVNNLARKPQGGDRDQIKAIAAGECNIAIVNHYYLAKMIDSNDKTQHDAAVNVKVVFPNQSNRGAHVNISGAGISANAKNYDNALKLLEFLVSDAAQAKFAAGNFEYPIVDGIELSDIVANFGKFTADPINVAIYGELNPEAIMMMDRVGWQ